jgi:hypothetical protein
MLQLAKPHQEEVCFNQIQQSQLMLIISILDEFKNFDNLFLFFRFCIFQTPFLAFFQYLKGRSSDL